MTAQESSTRVLARRFLGFGAFPLISLASPLVALPILARVTTIGEWSAIAIGQAVGALGSIVVSYGWTVTGAPEAARASDEARPALWLESVIVRCAVAAVVVPLVVVAAWALAIDGQHVLTAAAAAASSAAGFSVVWYAIGVSAPKLIAVYEAVPRVLGNLAGAVLVALTSSPVLFPVVVAAATLLPVAVFTLRVRAGGLTMPRHQVVSRLRSNAFAMATEASAGAYSVAAAALVGATGDARATALFNSGERVTRLGAVAIQVTGNSLQGWVAEVDGPTFKRRVRVSLMVHTGVGLAGLLTLGVGGPWITGLLFGSDLRIQTATGWALGIFYLFWSLETVTGRHVLAVRGRTGALLGTTIVGSLVGVAAVLVGAHTRGAPGAASGLAAAVALIFVCQAVVARRVLAEES